MATNTRLTVRDVGIFGAFLLAVALLAIAIGASMHAEFSNNLKVVKTAAADRGVTHVKIDDDPAFDCGAGVYSFLVTGVKQGQPYRAKACLNVGDEPMFDDYQ